jgi:hypothetical protein
MAKTRGTGLEAVQRRLALDDVVVAELARGRSYSDAGAAVGWSARTVGRRMRDPGYRHRVAEMRARWASELAGRLLDHSADAIDIVREEARTAEKSADRLRAAGMLLTIGLRFRQAHDLEERLRAVEDRLGLVDAEPDDDDESDRAPLPDTTDANQT